MKGARYFLGIGLIAAATQVHADVADDVTDILNKVGTIFTDVTGNIKDAATELINQRKNRSQAMRDNVNDLLTWFTNRQTPLQDFVQGGPGRCGTGSPCAKFRTELRTFALQMAELKERFPVLQQHGIGDTTFFADLVQIVPPVFLFGIHEILKRIPDWQDLPVDLADIFDELGDSDIFVTNVEPSPQVAATSLADGMKTALATARPAAGWGNKFGAPLEKFCSKGKEARIDDVRFNRLKGVVTRWKNRFDSLSEYPDDDAEITLAGEGAFKIKLPTKPFLKTVSNALDSLHDMMETHRANLELCAKIEADVAACTPLVTYRTQAGSKAAAAVVTGVLNRTSIADRDKTDANRWLAQARNRANASNWKGAFESLCLAYAAI